MNGTTTVRYATCDLQNRLTLSASKTTTPGIVIHRAVEATASGKWAITVESCGARLGFAKSENGARAVAGAYAGLPIRWDKIPEFKSREDMKLVVDVLEKRLASSPELLKWLHLIQSEGAS